MAYPKPPLGPEYTTSPLDDAGTEARPTTFHSPFVIDYVMSDRLSLNSKRHDPGSPEITDLPQHLNAEKKSSILRQLEPICQVLQRSMTLQHTWIDSTERIWPRSSASDAKPH